MKTSYRMTVTCFFCLVMLFTPAWQVLARSPEPINPSRGATVYLPVYPSIYFMGRKKSLELTVTLSIHNVSSHNAITVTKIVYHNKQGEPVKNIINGEFIMKPLETRNFVVKPRAGSENVGANFLIEWNSREAVHQPLIQGIMISTSGSQGISFITDGIPVETTLPAQD